MTRFIGWLAAVGLLTAAAPTAKAEFLVGLTTTTRLITFDSATPGVATGNNAVSGLVGGDTLLGIDYRPTTGVLYGLGQNNLYTLNATTGAVLTSTALAFPTGVTLSGARFGVDFNPVADLAGMSSLRVISDSGQNLAINVNGAVTPQMNITGGPVTGSAYTFNDADPATGTQLYGINPTTNALVLTASPPGGAYTQVGTGLTVDATELSGFDISGSGTAYAVFNNGTSNTGVLYTVNLATGVATQVAGGSMIGLNTGSGTGFEFLGLAALPAVATPLPPTLLVALAAPALLAFARRRRAVVA